MKGRCTYYVDPLSIPQDCDCDATQSCSDAYEPVESECVSMLDMSQAFTKEEPLLKNVTRFEKTSGGQKYVFGPEVVVNSSEI